MLKILDKVVLVISICTMAGLLGAYTSSYIDPNSFILPSLLGLAYPYLLIANLLLLLYWITRWKKTAWFVLVVILLGIPTFMTYYGTANVQEDQKKYDLSLLSYNVRYFDIYNWSKQKDTRQKLFDYLNRFEGDVICLQEFSLNSSSNGCPLILITTYTKTWVYSPGYRSSGKARFLLIKNIPVRVFTSIFHWQPTPSVFTVCIWNPTVSRKKNANS